MNKIFCLCLLISFQPAFAQEADTVKTLDEVVIKAFAHDRPLLDVPASVASIGQLDLQRFSNTNFLPALNAQPGVRMEERSPGSYRLSIRGSTIRLPFGVRNVKVYWNGLPLTDHGGNTYLNLLDFGSVDNAEVIKGPGSSLYGAGTGGVLMLRQSPINKNKITAELLGGSYGLFRYRGSVEKFFKKFNVGVSYAQQELDGYREHAALDRKMLNVRSNVFLKKGNALSFNLFYTHLFFQSPGGLNKIQYDTMPRMARPTVGANRGAVDQKAAIDNKTFFGGVSYEGSWGKNWSNIITGATSMTDFDNPTIAIPNYEKRDELTLSFRTEHRWTGKRSKFIGGAELQAGRTLISLGNNNYGDFIKRADVRLPSSTFLAFAQYDWNLPNDFFLTAGISLNHVVIKFDTLRANNYVNEDTRVLGSILSPRVALLKKVGSNTSVFASFSRGYSPPARDEIFPSLAVYNPNLKAEFGNNYEVSFKASWTWFKPSVTFYSLQLNQAIIKLDSDSDYFANAGRTLQNGIEVLWQLNPAGKVGGWLSYAYNHYRFKEYTQDNEDFSGNAVTGAAPHTLSTGLDYRSKNFYANITANYVDEIPLNDANEDFADAYFLMGCRLGGKLGSSQQFEIFGGVDNVLNTKYSLGNDLNALSPALRYYNAAPARNFYGGLKLRFSRNE